MGKVLASFLNGNPGAISRSVDDIVISRRNGSGAEIAFGAPVFLKTDGSVQGFTSSITDATKFLGFAVRAADKTPDSYMSNAASFAANEPVDILVRGSTVIPFESNAAAGDPVYIRVNDGKLTSLAGTSGSTIELPNVTCRTTRDSQRRVEIVLSKRNLV